MIKCVDFFCGSGGTSAGLMRAGIQIVVGVDNDPDAATTFRSNFPHASLLESDIRELAATDLESHISRDEKDIWLLVPVHLASPLPSTAKVTCWKTTGLTCYQSF